ncbi:MAG: family 20 glycosylhydrolase [Prolixibacteraceae bacterium]|nr:family 20 glycosylhydrolase [Prolixibacteraceae bacterium]
MIKKILFWVLGIILSLIIIGAVYFFVFIYKPPLISERDLNLTTLMPLPSKMKLMDGFFKAEQVIFRLNENCGSLVKESVKRISDGWNTGSEGKEIVLKVINPTEGNRKPMEDESYSLEVGKSRIKITAETEYGALWGLETLAQMAKVESGSVIIPFCKINDNPRYPWRGLMVDVCRHWIPKDVILRIIDGMAAVKLNVFHWHLTEYQAFRIESKVFPKLHQMGSDGNFYSQEEVKEVIQYAKNRGIRIVPEFDLPGHSTSWFVGYPELASAPGPYQCDTVFGVLNPVMDPTREEVYNFLDQFFGEMAGLFPDEYIHIGGDEVNPHDWERNSEIQNFMKEKGITDVHGLQAYFNKRLQNILEKHGKKMAGWDEILHPDLDSSIVVQSWRSRKSLWQAVQNGGNAILSAGWYLDHKLPAANHYNVDPEILPNAITIEPDSLNWETYSLELDFGDSPVPVELTLYGEGATLRGFMNIMEMMMGFKHATFENNELIFKVNSDYGELTCKAFIENEKFNGTFGLGIMKMDLKGEKTGGNNIPGTFPPKVEKTEPLTDLNKKHILGGEACMWTEVATAQNIESRIWPRTAAIAEKLWSPASLTKNPENMYRRLKVMDQYLVNRGAAYYKNQAELIGEIAGDGNEKAVKVLVDVLEEVKYYNRLGSYKLLTVNTPLNGLADAAMPESFEALEFNDLVEQFLTDSLRVNNYQELKNILKGWISNHDLIKELIRNSNKTGALEILSEKLKNAAVVGLILLENQKEGKEVSNFEKEKYTEILNKSSEPEAGAEIAIVNGIRKLL